MKGAGILVDALTGVGFEFWSHLRCYRENDIIFSREGLVYGCTQINIKIYIYYVYFELVHCLF